MIDINLVLVISVAILAFFSFCMFVVFVPIALQLTRTLSSAQYMLDTINDDFQPTVKEIKQSVDKFSGVVKKGSTYVQDSVKDAGVLMVSSAYGALVGFKNYLSSYNDNETGYNGKSKSEVEK